MFLTRLKARTHVIKYVRDSISAVSAAWTRFPAPPYFTGVKSRFGERGGLACCRGEPRARVINDRGR